MTNYKLRISLKVKFFNFFRKIFTYSFFENLLLKQVIGSPTSSFWRKLIPPNYIYAKPSNRNCTRNHQLFSVDISNVYEHYVYYGYPEKHFEIARQYFSKNMVVFDIGANIGAASLYFNAFAENCEIHAFEPFPDSYTKAKTNFELNNDEKIVLNKFALGDKLSEQRIYQVNERNPGMNRILSELNNSAAKALTIRVDTLDNYFSSNKIKELSMIKIDVEGYEMKVIMGGLTTIKNHRPIILVEVVDENLQEVDNSASELIELLINLGYLIFRVDKMENVTKDTLLDNCHFDALCLPQGINLLEIDQRFYEQ